MNDVLLQIRNLTVEFRVPRGILRAVDSAVLDIKRGEVLGLIGESGCGKSVLAHSILKIVAPNGYIKSGKILFEGRDVLSLSDEELRKYRWKEVAIIFQGAQNSLNPVINVKEHMLDTIKAHKPATTEEALVYSSSLLKSVWLEPSRVMKAYAFELSGGMKQRVITAMSMLLDPKLLILDEPTSSLDVLTQRYLLELLKDIHRQKNVSMLLITHDPGIAAYLADRGAIMLLGNIVEVGSVEQIFYNAKHPYTRALIDAVPSIVGNIKVKPIPGPLPDPVNPPPGCPFHPRCPYAMEVCKHVRPELIELENGRQVACHLSR